MIENNFFQFIQLWVAIEEGLMGRALGCPGDGKSWADHFVFGTQRHTITTINTIVLTTEPVSKETQDLDKLWCLQYLHLGSGLLTAFLEGGGEELMEGTHAVKLEKLVGMVQTDTQSKVRLNGPRLRRKRERDYNKLCRSEELILLAMTPGGAPLILNCSLARSSWYLLILSVLE